MEVFCIYSSECAPAKFQQNRGSRDTRLTCKLPCVSKIKQMTVFAQGLDDMQINIEVTSPRHKYQLCTLSDTKRCYELEDSDKDKALPNGKMFQTLKIVLVATLVRSSKVQSSENVADGFLMERENEVEKKQFTTIKGVAMGKGDHQAKLETLDYLGESSLLCLAYEKKRKRPLQDMSNKVGSPIDMNVGVSSSSAKKIPLVDREEDTNLDLQHNEDELFNNSIEKGRNPKRKHKRGKNPEHGKRVKKAAVVLESAESMEKTKTEFDCADGNILNPDVNKVKLKGNPIVSEKIVTLLEMTEIPTPTLKSTSEAGQMKEVNEKTPLETFSAQSPFSASKLSKKKGKSEQLAELTPTPRSRKQKLTMRSLADNTPSAKLCLMKNPGLASTELTSMSNDNENRPSTKNARCVDLSSRVPKPTSRWGHSLTLVSSKCAMLIGGQGDKQLSRDSIWSLNPETRCWKESEVTTDGVKPEYRMGHTATYDPVMRCIYVYGGSKNAKWFHDVHVFDLDESKWTLVKSNGKAPTRAYHSTTLFRHEMWVIGGVFPRPDPQPDGCDNDVHIFSPVMESWYKPIVTGDKPLARSGHSATCINDLLVVFGGWDFPYCYNDLHILDLTTVDWSAPIVQGTPPKPRSWHASCNLSNSRVFIHGGYDGDNALHDAHIFDLYSKSWQEVSLSMAPSARAGHKCLLLPSDYEDHEEDEVIVFGGGDNDGSYFSDMLSFYIPF